MYRGAKTQTFESKTGLAWLSEPMRCWRSQTPLPSPAKIYVIEAIAQVLVFRGEEPPDVSYKDKKGKYQSQTGVNPAPAVVILGR